MDGDVPYIAYFDGANDNKLTVQKYLSGNWTLVGTSNAYAANEAELVLSIRSGVPYIAFAPTGTADRQISVIKYASGKWSTVGNPSFTTTPTSRFDLVAATEAVYLAYQDVSANAAASVMKYTDGSCPLATLDNLSITPGQLDEGFESYVTHYTATLEYLQSSVLVTPIPSDPAATVTVNGQSPSRSIALAIGFNSVKVEVTSSDGVTKMTYMIDIYRKASSFATLCGLQLLKRNGDGSYTNVDYFPTFSTNRTGYSAYVDASISELYLLPTASAGIQIRVGESMVASGSISDAQPLIYDWTTLYTHVAAAGSDEGRSYRISVMRGVSDAIALQDIHLSTGMLSTEFNKDRHYYTAEVSPDISQVTITPTAASSRATIDFYIGENYIAPPASSYVVDVGTTPVSVGIEVRNGAEVSRYQVIVSHQGGLTSLGIAANGGNSPVISPSFDNKVTNYIIKLAHPASQLTFTPVAREPGSVIKVDDVVMSGSTATINLALPLEIHTIKVETSYSSVTYMFNIDQNPEETTPTPQIGFKLSELDVVEGDKMVNLAVVLDRSPDQAVTIQYAVTVGTATNGADYTFTNGTLTFEPCESEKNLSLHILDDNLLEHDETIIISLSNPAPSSAVSLSNSASTTVKIIDNDFPRVSFATSTSSPIAENGGAANVDIMLSESYWKPVRAYIGSGSGSAIKGTDFILGGPDLMADNRTVIFSPGQTQKTIVVTAVDNNLISGNKNAVLMIERASLAAVGAISSHTIPIRDNENQVYFSNSAAQYPEMDMVYTLPVFIDHIPTVATTVDFTVGGTASSADHTLVARTLTFSPTDTKNYQNISFAILPDKSPEPDETIDISLTNALPSPSVSIGSGTNQRYGRFVYTIVDDDRVTTLYVRASTAVSGNGQSWATAYKYLQDALIDAKNNLRIAEIHIAAGTYRPDASNANPGGTLDKNAAFAVRSNLKLLGGYPASGGETPRDPSANVTTLSGDLLNNDAGGFTNRSDNSSRIISIYDAGNIVIDGLTVANQGDMTYSGGMGAIRMDANATRTTPYPLIAINNCRLINNNLVFFANNYFTVQAQGTTFQNNQMTEGTGTSGTAICALFSSSIRVDRCQFLSNRNPFNGGAINAFHVGQFSLRNSVFWDNRVTTEFQFQGGGAVILDNVAYEIANCLFVSNSSAASGGALYITDGAAGSRIVNCTSYGNSASLNGGFLNYGNISGTSPLFIANSILWGDDAASQGDEINLNGSATSQYTTCRIMGIQTEDPLFVSTANLVGADNKWATADDGLKLSSASTCINAGTNNMIPSGVTADIAGDARIQNSIIDMGAYESSFSASASIRYVRANIALSGDGLSWNTAYANLQDALQEAWNLYPAITEIRIAAGIYYPDRGVGRVLGDRNERFVLAGGVALKGGYPANGGDEASRNIDAESNGTVFSGNIGDNSLASDNTERILVIEDGCIVDGFSIQDGYSDQGFGAAGYVAGNDVIIRNCSFKRNSANNWGGALFISFSNDLQINSCIFKDNSQYSNGVGGMGGGALVVYLGSDNLNISNCFFVNNTSAVNGGALYFHETKSKSEIINCVFSSNIATAFNGGAIYNRCSDLDIINCTFNNNLANFEGSAVFNVGSDQFSSHLGIKNSSLWGDQFSEIASSIDYAFVNISFSNIFGGFVGPNNKDVNPLFINANSPLPPAHGLIPRSIDLINAGDNSAVSGIQTDIRGVSRIIGSSVDIGAYEQ